MSRRDPSCRLHWSVLAGIGRIESGHARGGALFSDGRTASPILGPRLDGSLAGTATIRDSTGGQFDGDPVWERAVGPMQFLPSTWLRYGQDGNADGASGPKPDDEPATHKDLPKPARPATPPKSPGQGSGADDEERTGTDTSKPDTDKDKGSTEDTAESPAIPNDDEGGQNGGGRGCARQPGAARPRRADRTGGANRTGGTR